MVNHMKSKSKRIKIGEYVTICQRGKKGTWSAEFTRNGQHCRTSLKTTRQPEAERKARAIEVKLAEGTYAAQPKPQDIGAAITLFIASKKAEPLAAKSIVKYEAELKTFAAFAKDHGVTAVHKITPALFDSYRAFRLTTLTPYTVHNHGIIVKGFLTYCENREIISIDPLSKVRLREPTRGLKFCPTLEHVNSLLSQADSKFACQIGLLAFTGMRLGEMQWLRPGDVDLQNGWVRIENRQEWKTKTRHSRRVPIHRRLLPYLRDAMNQSRGKPYLFCSPASQKFPKGEHQINPRDVLTRFQDLAKRLGLPVGHKKEGIVVHSLRHFVESFCINNHVPQRVVDVWLGHRGGGGTGAMYYHLTDTESQQHMRSVPFDTDANPNSLLKGNSNVT